MAAQPASPEPSRRLSRTTSPTGDMSTASVKSTVDTSAVSPPQGFLQRHLPFARKGASDPTAVPRSLPIAVAASCCIRLSYRPSHFPTATRSGELDRSCTITFGYRLQGCHFARIWRPAVESGGIIGLPDARLVPHESQQGLNGRPSEQKAWSSPQR